MQSIYEFPIGIAILHTVEQGKTALGHADYSKDLPDRG
jgi:hypothetical protein